MYPVSDLFLQTLRDSHAIEHRVDAYRAGVLTLANVPISDGSVNVDSGSQIRRTLSLKIADPALDPGNDPDAVLAPYGAELHVRTGIRFPNGTIEWVPLGWFRVEQVAISSSDTLALSASDRAAYIKDARFSVLASVTSNTIPTEIARLITTARPGTVVDDLTGSTAATPNVFWEQERWPAINDLADAIGADVYFTPEGDAVIAPVPAIDDPPVWWVDAGETGVMIESATETTREGTYNAVIASGEAAETAPVTATVVDDNPSSPTYYDGPFGKKPYFYTSPFITTTAQATSAAQAILDRVRGMSRQLTLTSVPNPALEGGDVIRVRFADGSVETHLVDAFSIPLNPDGSSSITTRSPNPETE